MMGLDNAPAYKELKEIKFGIRKLFEIKIKDTKDIERENKRQKEQDKRDAQDVQRVLKNDKALMQGWGTSLENSEAGLMAALLGGAALFGAASMLAGFDLQEFIDDVSNNISRFLDNVLPSSPSMKSRPNSRSPLISLQMERRCFSKIVAIAPSQPTLELDGWIANQHYFVLRTFQPK